MIVVFCHISNMMPAMPNVEWWFEWSPLNVLIAGQFAVIVFFVLSGFVLALPYANGSQQSYGQYLIRRVCRIYLPFVAAVLLASVLALFFAEHRAAWHPRAAAWAADINANMLISHLAMVGVGERSILINGVIWTLIFEMRISILFPIIILIVKRFGFLAVVSSFAIGAVLVKLIIFLRNPETFFGMVGDTPLDSFLLTIYYMSFFILGAWAAYRHEYLRTHMLKIPTYGHIILFSALVYIPLLAVKHQFVKVNLFEALAAVYMIISIITFENINAFLLNGPIKWLGKVSYSMYLIHFPIMAAMVYALYPYIPAPAVLVLSFPTVLLSSELMQRLIERPSMQLGKRLATQLQRNRAIFNQQPAKNSLIISPRNERSPMSNLPG